MRTRKLLVGDGFVGDNVAMAYDQSGHGYAIAERKEYDRVIEKLDLQAPAPWVLWRRLLQGGSSL